MPRNRNHLTVSQNLMQTLPYRHIVCSRKVCRNNSRTYIHPSSSGTSGQRPNRVSHSWTLAVRSFFDSITEDSSVQFLKREIVGRAASFLVIKAIRAHICLLQLLRPIVERSRGMRVKSYNHRHLWCKDSTVRAANPFGGNSEYF